MKKKRNVLWRTENKSITTTLGSQHIKTPLKEETSPINVSNQERKASSKMTCIKETSPN